MARSTSTPPAGPWTAEPRGDGFFRVVNDESVVVADRCVREEALLTAAAPDLFYACYLAYEEIAEWMRVMGPLDTEDHRKTFDAIAALKDAIAKAEGR